MIKPRQLAFTGTQQGMTDKQYLALDTLLTALKPIIAVRHGDCIGADAEFHRLCKEHKLNIIIHPPSDPKKRAFCTGAVSMQVPRSYLIRNRLMVEQSDLLIATPRQAEEVVRSGTWMTIRHARRIGKELYIVNPDGTYARELSTARVDARASGHPHSVGRSDQPE